MSTLVLGLEHFIDKIGYQAAEYARRGIEVRYLVLDQSGLSHSKAAEYDALVDVVPTSLPARIAFTIRTLRQDRPRYVELYDIGRLTLLYALLARAFGAQLIVILRGFELRTGPARQVGLRRTLRIAHRIIAKELHIVRDLKAMGIPEDRVTFIGNCVPLPEVIPSPIDEREIDILFLNAVRRMRNPDLLVRALPAVFERFPDAKVTIAGFTHLDGNAYRMEEETEHEVLALIDELGLGERIEVVGFVPNADVYFRRAKIFVLPADTVFANYALLEAMSHGVVPLVADGEGAERIVDHEENGLIVPRTAEAIADGLIRLLEDPGAMARYAAAARRTIAEEFSIETWGGKMQEARGAPSIQC